jgi:exosortase
MSKVEQQPASDSSSMRSSRGRRRQNEKPPRPQQAIEKQPLAAEDSSAWLRLLFGGLALAAGAWAYWPTLVEIVATWNREPDYSHGFLVVPVAICFLWARRASCPNFAAPATRVGLILLGISLAARYFGARFFMEFIDGYSILVWLAAVVALIGGWRMLLWTLPSIGFLFFMIPLPFGIETAMSYPLQRIATEVTCWILQVLGQPAFAEGNVILLGDHELEIAQACSGLRLFMSIVALAYAYVVLVHRAWWEKLILLWAIVPIAIVSNATRIVVTGLLFQFTTGKLAHDFAHDFAGWAMIPFAAALFGLVLWYLGKLFRVEEVLDMSAIVHEAKV